MNAPFDLSLACDLRPGPIDVEWVRHYEELLEEFRFADELGFRGVRVAESHGHEDGMAAQPFVALAAIAAVTEKLRLMTYVIPIALRQWREIVEQASLVDVLSGGRVEIGLGAGGTPKQFEIFSKDMRERGRLTDESIPFIRRGLAEGVLPDGPKGSSVPVSPPPVQQPVPIYVGGLSRPAIERAARLGDGCLGYDYVNPEEFFPTFYADLLEPTLSKFGRSLSDFYFGATMVVWVTDDPERDWTTIIEPALTYRQKKYLEWERGESELIGMTSRALREGVIVDTPENCASRLLAVWQKAPWHDLAFWQRLPGVSHDQAMGHMERVSQRLLPLLSQDG